MNISTAKLLIEDTFSNPFDINKFEHFLTEVFDNPKLERTNQINYIGKGYYEYVNKVCSLGLYTDSFKNTIRFYVIELSKSSSVDRARTIQRNIVAKLMKNQNVKQSLVAFYEPNSKDWRFSYVKFTYEYADGSINENLSSPKRHSFLVGPNEPNNTCSNQFKKILISNEKVCLEDIEDAFSIENVTKEFFDKYKSLFLDLKEAIDELIETDKKVFDEFKLKNINSVDFAKKIMGQLVFIYFLQKKGWLGISDDNKYGTGPKNFLNKLFNKEYGDYNNFFNDVLEPLFYTQFSGNKNKNYKYDFKFNFKVPFLNGGLFEPVNNYDWENTDLIIPNNIFKEILDTFNKFNFTIKEDEPLEKEVAVDPEMLGKIFERLLGVTKRKETGSYYTKRSIVHHICQECLISYLDVNLVDVPKEDIIKFIKNGHIAMESIFKQQLNVKKYGGTFGRIDLPQSILDNSGEIYNLLSNVKIIDPAVGSGAFPVGMMNEIVQAKQIIALTQQLDISMYDMKRNTIENSLYGVDISASAVDITKLRFWLSLVVDEEDIDYIKPLPNLDDHIMCGNSVIDGFDGIKLYDDSYIKVGNYQDTLIKRDSEIRFNEIENMKKDYFAEDNPEIKLKIRNKINEIKFNFVESKLREVNHEDKIKDLLSYNKTGSLPFFIWELEFSEVFKGKNPGFDIVIGNPPYGDLLSKEEKDYTKKYYKANPKDISALFMEKGFNLLNDKGCLGYIITFALTFNKNFSEVRELIEQNFDECYISSFDRDKCRLFEGASQSVSIVTCLNKNNGPCDIFTTKMFRETPESFSNLSFMRVNNFNLEKSIGVPFSSKHRLAKVGDIEIYELLKQFSSIEHNIYNILKPKNSSFWIRTSGNYWYNCWDKKPYESSKIKKFFADLEYRNFLISLINSSLFYLWMRIYGDGRDLNQDILKVFPIIEISDSMNCILKNNVDRLMFYLFENFDDEKNRFATSNVKCIIDISDVLLCKLYGLSNEEIKYILDYDKVIRGGQQIPDCIFIIIDYIIFLDKNNILNDKVNLFNNILTILAKEIYLSRLNNDNSILINEVEEIINTQNENINIKDILYFLEKIENIF